MLLPFREHGDAVYFHQEPEQADGHGRPRRGILAEELPVHLVELREPGEVRHVGVHLHDVFQARSRGFQDRLYVPEGLAHLVREGVGHGAGLGVHGTLAGYEHEAVGDDGMGVGAGRLWSFFGCDGLSHVGSSFLIRTLYSSLPRAATSTRSTPPVPSVKKTSLCKFTVLHTWLGMIRKVSPTSRSCALLTRNIQCSSVSLSRTASRQSRTRPKPSRFRGL